MKIVLSKEGVPIRLTPERMQHISRRHPEMAGQEEKSASHRRILWKQ
jgi:hypothetical protein